MRLPQFDGLLGKVYVRFPWVELWYNGQRLWWVCIGGLCPTPADAVGEAIDYCLSRSGSLPNLYFEESPMTEKFLLDLAERYGLNVLKRITTGEQAKHFATFELSGDRCADAWSAIKDKAARGFAKFAAPSNPDFKDKRPYIEVQSVWCE